MKNTIYKYFIIAILAINFSACDDYLDVNYDPSNPQTADGGSLLPPLLANMARGEAFDTRYVGQYVQNWSWKSKDNAFDQHGYSPGSDAAGEKWRQHYWAIGKNIDVMIEDATKKEQWNYVGVAKLVRAWSWLTSSDVYGEMILDQAWEPNRYVFDYNDQKSIYAEAEKLANEGIELLGKTSPSSTKEVLAVGDLVYKGDVEKWRKFGYAVLARQAHRFTNKTTYNPDKVIEYVDKSFSSNTDNFNVPMGDASATSNFFGPLRNNLSSFRPSTMIVGLLDGTVLNGVLDPRISKMISPSPDGVFRGVSPGYGDTTDVKGKTTRIPLLWGVDPSTPTLTTLPGKYIFRTVAPHTIVSYAELQFIKAEAAFIKGDKTMAHKSFLNGVAAHLDFAEVAAKDKEAYMASAAIPQEVENITLKDIMLQKYIALWVIGALETWVDMRRHHYDNQIYDGFKAPNKFYIANGGSKYAYRLRPRYNSEYVWNTDALSKLGADKEDFHTTELWFSLK